MYVGGFYKNSYNTYKKKRATIQQFYQTFYHLLLDSDEIEYGRYQEVANSKFQFVIKQILKDLNFVLYLNEEEFWNHLEKQTQLEQQPITELLFAGNTEQVKATIRLCLQSCLNIFSRRSYLHYHQFSGESNKNKESGNCCSKVNSNFIKQLQQLPQFWFKVWYQLKKVVLIIFYRICCSQTEKQKEIRFQGWYIDTCKMLDICLIYGKQNPQIVRKMAALVFVSPEELQDFRQCINLTLKHLQRICFQLHYLKVDIKTLMQNINKEQITCEQPMEVIMQQLSSLMFKICDVMFNLESILYYFPQVCQQILLQETLIFKRLIMIYCKLKKNMENNWLLGDYEKKYRTFSYLIYQKITVILAKGLILLHEVLVNSKQERQELKKLKTTFINICHFIFITPAINYEDRENQRIKQLYIKYQLNLAKSILEVNPNKSIFANSNSIALFDRMHKNFFNLSCASFFQNNFKATEWKRIRQMKKYVGWKLPSSAQIFKNESQEKLMIDKRIFFKKIKEYEDDPQFSDEQIQTEFSYQKSLDAQYLQKETLQEDVDLSQQKRIESNNSQIVIFSQQKQNLRGNDEPENSLGQLSISTIQMFQKIVIPDHSIDLNDSRCSSVLAQTSNNNTGLTKTVWSQSNQIDNSSQVNE